MSNFYFIESQLAFRIIISNKSYKQWSKDDNNDYAIATY